METGHHGVRKRVVDKSLESSGKKKKYFDRPPNGPTEKEDKFGGARGLLCCVCFFSRCTFFFAGDRRKGP